MTESELLRAVLLRCSQLGAKLWRNTSGATRDERTGNWITYGLANPGGSDLIGYRPVVITPAMVGTTIAQFVALECKGQRGTVSDEQRQFLQVARQSGALAGVVWTVAPIRSAIVRPAYELLELSDLENEFVASANV